MKKYILIVCSLLSFNAFAEDIGSVRQTLSNELNTSVKEMKNLYSITQGKLNDTKSDADSLIQISKDLAERSKANELNPKVLHHGNATISKSCDYSKKSLGWNGSSWECKDMEVDKECQAPASDEFMYKDSSGNNKCSKVAKGSSINYYWTFRGYSAKCSSVAAGRVKLYDCNYKNKLNQVIQVSDGYCASKTKPNAAKSLCTTSWSAGNWGGCSKSCNGGQKYRSVTCPAGYACTGTKPTNVTSCNTHRCTTHWRAGGWGGCNKSCGGGRKYRSVYCPSGFACVGSKPTNVTSCNTHACRSSGSSCSSRCVYASSRDAYNSCMRSCSGGGSSSGGCRAANGCGRGRAGP